MKIDRSFYLFRHWWLAVSAILLLVVSGCTIKLVADYDAATYEEILRVGKRVDQFYGMLLEQDEASRAYQNYAAQYVEIETELRSLYVRNMSRPLNDESTKIADSILQLWMKYKDRHQTSNGYKTGVAKLDRNRFVRMFISAASAESAKQAEAEGQDSPPSES